MIATNQPITSDDLETIVDTLHLDTVLDTLSAICEAKAEHIRSNWQDEPLAAHWDRSAKILATASRRPSIARVS